MGSDKGAFASHGRFIPETLPAGLLALDKDGSITATNDSAAEMLGRESEALVGTPLAQYLSAGAARRLEKHLRRAGRERMPVRFEVELDESGEARARYVLIQMSAEQSPGDGVAYHAVLVDVTSYVDDVKQAEQGRLAAENVARSKADFLARLSHEIRSSLASMIGFADVLIESVPDADREVTEIIRDSGRHILDTLNSVMDLARIEFENGRLELTKVDVVHRVRRRTATFERLAASHGLELTFRAESDRAEALLNATFLERIVHNLIDNAIKYTPEGRVEVSVEERDGSVWIYVADTGLGMQSEFLPRLFSPFEREHRDESDATEGAGLGLAVTKYLVELMGGRITACSTEGEGSTFTVSFPVAETEE